MTISNINLVQRIHIVAAISFDDADTDIVYVTRFTDSEVPAASTFLKGHLKKLSGTTQAIKPGQRKATIGQMSFSLVDIDHDVSTLLNTKLASNKGLRGKRVQYYIGYDEQTWSEYQLVQTQFFHKSIKQKGDQFSFLSKDVQRTTVSKIFVNKKTTLVSTISDTDTIVTLADASEFEFIQHDASYNDSPSSSVLYIKIDKEVIRCISKSNNDLTVDTNGRGALGTKPAVHEVNADAEENRKLLVSEFIYLEGAIPKILWAVLTGQLLNQAQGLPDHWHLGVDTQYVNLQDFLNIGNDLWDFNDATIGRFASYEGLESISGKKFIEEQLLIQGGLYQPIGADGALKLKRITGVLSSAVGIAVLDPSNIVSHSDLDYVTGDIFNKVVIDWGYSHLEEKFIRSNILIDQSSIDIWGETTEPKFLEMRGLTGNRHSDEDLERMFSAFRDRYAGPPLEINVVCLPSIAHLEVGDVVELQHPNIRDFLTNAAIDRSFEVQQVNIDWQTGKVSYRLYASSQKASTIPVTPVDNIVSSTAYTSEGTDLTTVLTINVVGDLGRIQANGSLTGDPDMTDGNAIYYYNGDLQLDDGFAIAISENVQLRVNGHFQLNGFINGKGAGLTGISPPPDQPYLQAGYGAGSRNTFLYNLTTGQQGYIGTTVPGGGIMSNVVSDYSPQSPPDNQQATPHAFMANTALGDGVVIPDNIARGVVKVPDDLNLKFENNSIVNVPTDLRGCSGGHGAPVVGIVKFFQNNAHFSKSGGAGGNGGAGLFILAKGMTRGGSGNIDLSGDDGIVGGKYQWKASNPNFYGNVIFWYAGTGSGGSAGALVVCIDGASAVVPNLTGTNIDLYHGATPEPSAPSVRMRGWAGLPVEDGTWYKVINDTDTIHGYFIGIPTAITNNYDSNYLLTYIQSDSGIVIDVPPFTEDVLSLSAVVFPNTPKRPNADLSTIEVTVDEPSTGHYSHSSIYFKTVEQIDWTFAGPADPVYPIEALASNGTVYDIQARSVSINGNESPAGPQIQITLPDVDAAVESGGSVSDPNVPLVDPIITVPIVRHLRLAEDNLAGSLDEFTGKHAKFVWAESADSEWFEVGSEPLTQGAEAGARDQYFSHYEIKIYSTDTGNLVWTDTTVENFYDYTFERNVDSASASISAGGDPAELQIILPSDVANFDYAGTDAVISDNGTVLVTGSPFNDHSALNNPGAAYAYDRSGDSWINEQKLIASDALANDKFGHQVYVSGDGSTIIVSAHEQNSDAADGGALYVFVKIAGIWTQQARIVPDIAPSASDKFSFSIGISYDGNTIIASSPFEADGGANRGAVYIFTRSGTTWTQQARITPATPTNNIYFGYNVYISKDGSTAFIGAVMTDNSGKVFIKEIGTGWADGSEDSSIVASDASASDFFGAAVNNLTVFGGTPLSASYDGTKLFVGAYGRDGLGSNRGAVYYFKKSGSVYSEIQIISNPSVTQDSHFFGYSVSADNNATKLAVGAQSDDTIQSNSGRITLYVLDGTTYTQDLTFKALVPSANSFWSYRVFMGGAGNYLSSAASDFNGSGIDLGATFMYDVSSVETGPFRRFRFEVDRVSRLNTRSASPASIVVENPAPALPDNLSVTARFSSFSIAFDEPRDPDYLGMRVWVDTSSGFILSDLTLVFDGPGNPINIDSLADNVKVDSGVTYYVRFAPYDAFGRIDLNQSSEFVVLTEQIDTVDLSGLGPWAFEVDPIDAEFILTNLAANAVPSEKIINLTAAKLTTGVLLATIEIQSGGLIKATNTGTDYEIRMGFEVDSGIPYIFRYGDFTSVSGISGASDMPFTIDADGNIKMSGNIEINSGDASLVMDAANSQIYINDGQFGNQGIQLQYNSGNPRLYVGDGDNKFVEFDGTDLSVGTESNVRGTFCYNNTDIFYYTNFDSIDGWSKLINGGGVASVSGGGVFMSASASGDSATIIKGFPVDSLGGVPLSFVTASKFKIRVETSGVLDAVTNVLFARGFDASDKSGYGFEITGGGLLKGFVNVGDNAGSGNYVTTALLKSISSGSVITLLEAVYTPGSAGVEFFVDGVSAAIINSDVISTTTDINKHAMRIKYEKTGASFLGILRFSQFRFYQEVD